jgi:hypothetical protein
MVRRRCPRACSYWLPSALINQTPRGQEQPQQEVPLETANCIEQDISADDAQECDIIKGRSRVEHLRQPREETSAPVLRMLCSSSSVILKLLHDAPLEVSNNLGLRLHGGGRLLRKYAIRPRSIGCQITAGGRRPAASVELGDSCDSHGLEERNTVTPVRDMRCARRHLSASSRAVRAVLEISSRWRNDKCGRNCIYAQLM